MGEKEQGTARESGSPSVSEREAGMGLATGDPDFDTARSSVKSSKSNTSERQAGTVLSPDMDLLDDDADARSGIVKSKSNITNNREGAPGGSGADKAGPIRIDSTPARVSEGVGNDIAIGDPGVNEN